MAKARLFYKPSELINDHIKPTDDEERKNFNSMLDAQLEDEFGLLKLEYEVFKLTADNLAKSLTEFDDKENGKQSVDAINDVCKRANDYLERGWEFKREMLGKNSYSSLDPHLLDVRLAIPKDQSQHDKAVLFEPLKAAVSRLNSAIEDVIVQRKSTLAVQAYHEWKDPPKKSGCTLI